MCPSVEKSVERYGLQSPLRSINRLWTEYREYLLCLVILLMAALACQRMVKNFSRLLLEDHFVAAIDLRLRYRELHHWFAGKTIYLQVSSAVYPPASYAMLWPLLGYSSFTVLRWIWGFTSGAALAWLVHRLFVKKSRVQTLVERVWVAPVPLSTYPALVSALLHLPGTHS